MCIGQQCAFVTSVDTVPEKKCQEMKREFLTSNFKPEVTLAASQCMEFTKNKVQI
jgi:thioesterase domain-containing protein